MNDALCRDFRIKPEELLGRNFVPLTHYADRERMAAGLAAFGHGKHVPMTENRVLLPDGTVRWQQWSIRPVLDKDGNLAEIQGVGRDITERKRAEETLADYQKQLKSLSSQLLVAQENERRRIAQEIHDGLATQLAAVKYSLERKVQQLGQGPPKDSGITIEEIISLLGQAMEETRRIMSNLRPSLLDDLGIVPTLSWYFREFRKTYPEILLEEAITIEEDGVPEHLKIVIFRILQEAASNAARHSRANRIRVALEKKEGRIQFTVADNGHGFDPRKAAANGQPQGLGLVSMRERAEFTGGTFTVESQAGQGTLLQASWPASSR